jgi:hypothetical protein
MSDAPTPSIHLLFATENNKVVILYKLGKTIRQILWDRDSGTFEDGQWIKRKFRLRDFTISPDAKHLMLFSFGRYDTETKGEFVSISRVPYFTAISLYPAQYSWDRFGFIDSHHYVVDNPNEDLIKKDDGLRRVFKGETTRKCPSGYYLRNSNPTKLGKAKADAFEALTMPEPHPDFGRYEVKGSKLYRRSGFELELIRDFGGMQFEAIKAPYDWRKAKGNERPRAWHPLEGENT